MKRAILLLSLLGGCAAEMTITYHRVELAPDRTLMVLVSKEQGLDQENPVDLLDRLQRRGSETYRANLGAIGDRSFASIDSGTGLVLVTAPGTSDALDALLAEVAARRAKTPDEAADLRDAKRILESLGARERRPPSDLYVPRPF